MALTTNGFELERFAELLDNADEEIQAAFGGGVDLSPDSLINTLNSIVVRGESELWELCQGAYDSTNLMAAEGAMLDNLVLLVGFVRLPASQTYGEVLVTSEDGVLIPQDTVFTSIAGDTYEAVSEQLVTSTSCRDVRVVVQVVDDIDFNYNINIDGNLFTYTSQAGDDVIDILLGIQNSLDSYGGATTTFVEDYETPENSYLTINKIDRTSNMSLSSVTYLKFDYVSSPISVTATQFGAIPAHTDTVNAITLEGENTGSIYSVTNPDSFITGRDLEEDFQLRERVLAAYTTISGGTPDTIVKAVSAVPSVSRVIVQENMTNVIDSKGLPPKSYRVIVYGGNDELVAQAIWKSKPAGISSYSYEFSGQTVLQEITDYNSQSHVVAFTRPDVKYVWVQVEYTTYSEELLTEGIDSIIKETIATEGQKLSIGEDVISKRFVGPIYRTTNGLLDIIIKTAITDDTNTIPDPEDYSEDRISIKDSEITDFAVGRMTTVKN